MKKELEMDPNEAEFAEIEIEGKRRAENHGGAEWEIQGEEIPRPSGK